MPEPVTPLTRKILTLLALPGVGQQTVRKLLQYPHLQQVEDVQELGFLDPRLYRAVSNTETLTKALEATEAQLEQAETLNMQILSLPDAGYPALLKGVADAPLVLYLQGHWHEGLPTLTLTGTRTPTKHGALTTERITGHFVQQGHGVIASLFPGCAAIGLQTALKEGGIASAVFPGGLDQPFPPSLKRLSEQLLEAGGALLSPFAPGTLVRNHQFVQRDRVQAGLGHGTLLVQSGLDGTSLHTFRAALRDGRPVAVPLLSQTDQQAALPVTAVNRLLFSGAPDLGTQLDLSPELLSRVILLHGKADYALLEQQMEQVALKHSP